MTDLDTEDYYFYGARVPYEAPYHPQWCPPVFLYAGEEEAPRGTTMPSVPKEAPRGYRVYQDSMGIALSIPPADGDPMPRIRRFVAALQQAVLNSTTLDNDIKPTVYMTFMPVVPGNARQMQYQSDKRAFWATRYSHPGVTVYPHKNAKGETEIHLKTTGTVRMDATWQVTLFLDPMGYVGEDWRAGFADYPLTVFTDTAEHTLRFQDLHDACPLIGVLIDPGFEGCLGCAHNDIFCRTRFLREHLDAIDPGILEKTVWWRKHQEDSAAVSLGCKMAHDMDAGDFREMLKKVDCPGFKLATASSVQADDNPSIHNLRMGWATVREKTKKKRAAAERGAETRKKHDEICGKGDGACVLREEGCMQWRGWRSCSHRRYTLDELNEEALARFTKLSSVPLLDLQRGALLASVDFQYATDTGRLRDGEYCGTLRSRKSPGTGAYRVLLGPSRKQELHYFKDWAAQKRWLRRHAPWELERIEAVETLAPKVEISPLMRAVFYAMQGITYIRVGGGYGGSSHAIQMYRFRLTQHVDPERYKVAYEVVAQGNGYSLCAQDMFGFWQVKSGGFTGAGGILPP